MVSDDFGADFQWGVSSAAFQTEGACQMDGKGPSIWDTFTARKGKIRYQDKAHSACDFYRRYQDDIALVRELNIPNFRFSLSWPRILPKGTGAVSQRGIDRSEERRVGKEWRSGWWEEHQKKKKIEER